MTVVYMHHSRNLVQQHKKTAVCVTTGYLHKMTYCVGKTQLYKNVALAADYSCKHDKNYLPSGVASEQD